MAEELVKVAPEVCSYVDDEHSLLTIEISIPGVEKENINLRMHDDSLNLNAPREEIEFVTTLSFCCPVDPDKADATYRNGQLIIKTPFKDVMADAKKVDIN